MSYATLMVYINAGNEPEAMVRMAAGLADRFGATLIGASALAIRPPFIAEGVVIEEVTEADLRKRLADQERWFRRVTAAENRKREWRSVLNFPTEALAQEARSADLLIIGQSRDTDDVYSALDPGGAILASGRPVLVAPDGVESLRADHVVIGWKEAREARRAVRDALPLLREATRVTLVEICRSNEKEPARAHLDDVARYLDRHRIASGPMVILHQEGSGAEQLIRLAQRERADLVVTGAYGHSRLGQWVFGGMTQDLLTASPICCLMSH
jgi:nucleotide-binding universal stress UspA family protein